MFIYIQFKIPNMKIPNLLTLLRFLLTPFIIYLSYTNSSSNHVIAMILFILVIISDGLDGYIARNFKKQKSDFGFYFDGTVDKIVAFSLFIMFVDLKIIPIWLCLLFIYHEMIILGLKTIKTVNKMLWTKIYGRFKFLSEAAGILYLQIVLYLSIDNGQSILFTKEIGVIYITTLVIIHLLISVISLIFYRKKLLKDF